MNFTTPLRRTIAVAALLSSFAGAVGAAGAAHADSTTPAEPTPVEAPVEPITPDAPPGPVDGGDVAAPTTTMPPVETDPVTTPAPTEPEAPTPPPVETPTTSPQGGKPPVTTTPSAIATVTTTPAAVTTVPAALAASAPQSPVAKPGIASVNLTWSAPASNGGAAIDKYAVQSYTANGWANVAFPTGLGYTVGSLANGTKYSFRILAHNAAGWSIPSTVVSAVTLGVPSAPQSVVATPYNGSVKLTWKAPANNGGAAVTKYAVQRYNPLGQWQTIAGTTTLGYTATGLTNGTKYSFRIRALNAVGWGTVSTVVSAVPRTIPGAPIYLVATPNDTGDVMVTWKPPSSNGGATVDLYEVQRATSWIGPWTKVADVGALGRLDDSALTPGATYFYRVSAHNAAGWGAWSTLVAGVPRTAPAMVPWCNFYQQGSMRIQLKWQVPANNGAAIDYYWVELWKNGKFYIAYKKEAYQTDGGAQVYSTGLYDVRISAHNVAGYGPYCQQSTFVSY